MRWPCSAKERSWIPSSGATSPASCAARTCFIRGNKASNMSSVSNPPLDWPASRNFKNGASDGSLTVHLRFCQHLGGLFPESPDVTNPHLEFSGNKLFKLRVQLQALAYFQSGRQRQVSQIRISRDEVQQEIAIIFAHFFATQTKPVQGSGVAG